MMGPVFKIAHGLFLKIARSKLGFEHTIIKLTNRTKVIDVQRCSI